MILNVELDQPYPIYIDHDNISKLPDLLKKLNAEQELFVITDENVSRYHIDKLINVLKNSNLDAKIITVKPGESSKSLETANEIYTQLIQYKATRNAVILAFGGGVVGDLAGYIAATYLRGVRFVQIPTTILSQVDSSVGGKVGINHQLGKNLIGAFYQPLFVLIDSMFLKTLPPREIIAGMGEVVKYGFIWDELFLEKIQQNWASLIELSDRELLENILYRCCEIKADVVAQDERESGLRAILNFGHTIGHALEAATHYKHFLHGEAVIHGMKGALYLSLCSGSLSDEKYNHYLQFMNTLPVPAVPDFLDVETVKNAMLRDKKRSAKGQLWVLVNKIGKAVLKNNLDEAHVEQAIELILNNGQQ